MAVHCLWLKLGVASVVGLKCDDIWDRMFSGAALFFVFIAEGGEDMS